MGGSNTYEEARISSRRLRRFRRQAELAARLVKMKDPGRNDPAESHLKTALSVHIEGPASLVVLAHMLSPSLDLLGLFVIHSGNFVSGIP